MGRIELTENLGYHYIRTEGFKIEATRTGTMAYFGADPVMRSDARVTISSSPASEGVTLTLYAGQVRALATYLDDVAEAMDPTPAEPTPEPTLLVKDDGGDWFYTGPLAPAERLVRVDREILVSHRMTDVGAIVHVDLVEGGYFTEDKVAEFGAGRTKEEAKRYAFGAYFGPADEGYDEARLALALARGSWSATDTEYIVLPPHRLTQAEVDAGVGDVLKPRLSVGESGEPVVDLPGEKDDGLDRFDYKPTHVSTDGLTAMFVRYDAKRHIVLVYEDGHEFRDFSNRWTKIENYRPDTPGKADGTSDLDLPDDD
jgi:hypothetical protein